MSWEDDAKAQSDPVPQWEMDAIAQSEQAEPGSQAQEATKGLLRRGVEWAGRQAARIPAAIRGGVQAYQEHNAPDAAAMAWRGLADPGSVQSSAQMMANFGADAEPSKPQIKTPAPGAQFNFKTKDFTPATSETSYTSPAQEMGTAFDVMAPTGLEMALPVLKVAGLLSRGAAKGVAAAADMASGGTMGSDVLEGIGQGARAYKTRQAAKIGEVLNPKFAPDAPKYQQIGQSLGFTPEEASHPAIQFGGNSAAARRNRVLAQDEGGQPYLDQHNAISDKIQQGFDQVVHSIGGPPLEPTHAGEIIRQGVKNGAKRIAESVTASHGDIIEQFPGLTVTGSEAEGIAAKLHGIEKFAKGRAIRGVVPEQRAAAESLLGAVDAIRSSNMSYKQLNEAREMIGDIAFDDVGAVGQIPAYQQKMRDLYFGINDAMIETVGKMDRVRSGQFRPSGQAFEPIKDKLIESNKILHEMFQDEGAIGRALGNAQKAPEQVFNQALLHGDSRKVKALRNLLTPQELQQAKGAYLQALVKRGKDDFTYKSARNALAQNRSVVDELFADSPDQIKKIRDIIDLGDRVGPPLLPGSSGQLDFGGVNSIVKAITAPVGDVTAEIGKVRASRIPQEPNRIGWSPIRSLPIHQALKLARPQERPGLPPYLNGGN